MLTSKKKQDLMKKFGFHEKDSGSAHVQIAFLTKRINDLAVHLKKNRKDEHSRRGLLGLVADRRKHLKYLETTNKRAYGTLVKKLGLKK